MSQRGESKMDASVELGPDDERTWRGTGDEGTARGKAHADGWIMDGWMDGMKAGGGIDWRPLRNNSHIEYPVVPGVPLRHAR